MSDLETRTIRMGMMAFAAAAILAVCFILLAVPLSSPAPAPVARTVYVYHNSTVFVNTTTNITTPEWSNTTVYVNTTFERVVYVNTTLIEFVPVVFIANVTYNGGVLASPHDLNISTGAVLWLRLNASCPLPSPAISPACGVGCSYSYNVDAPFVLLSSSESDRVATLLVGVPYLSGVYNLTITGQLNALENP